MKRRDDPKQTLIDWGNPQAPAIAAEPNFPDPIKLIEDAPPLLVQRLPWDFVTTFPKPTDDAVDAGVVDESDLEPENLKSLHDNYSRQCLATLQQLDKVMDARRRNVEPGTGKVPKTHAARERLTKYLAEEPDRLEHAYRVLIETYENAFGPEAAQAFSKCIRARQAGIRVETEAHQETEARRPAKRRQSPAVLPVPKPLADAVSAKHFGEDDQGKPVHPSPAEVRAITENHADRLIDLLDSIREFDRILAAPVCSDRARNKAERNKTKAKLKEAVDLYAGSFGQEAAERLHAYARRQLLVSNAVSRT